MQLMTINKKSAPFSHNGALKCSIMKHLEVRLLYHMNEKKSNVKKRNWAFVLYPESAPEDWREILQTSGLQCAVSPLHDKDLNADGTEKKAHWHVIAIYSGPTSFNVVNALCSKLNAPHPQPLEQVRGYYRYLSHKDNPEKAQYDERDITTINGFNIADFVELTRSEVNNVKFQLQKLIREQELYEYSDFMDYLQDNDMRFEYDVASSHTMFFDRYIQSRRFKQINEKHKIDPETGEVIE